MSETRGGRGEWAVPRLYLRTRPDRVSERRSPLRSVLPDTGRPKERLLVVGGEAGVVKSAVVRSVLLTCHLRGQRVV